MIKGLAQITKGLRARDKAMTLGATPEPIEVSTSESIGSFQNELRFVRYLQTRRADDRMKRPLGFFISVLALGACAQTPMGPTIPVMPGPNTSFSAFQNDQAVCRNFAEQACRIRRKAPISAASAPRV